MCKEIVESIIDKIDYDKLNAKSTGSNKKSSTFSPYEITAESIMHKYK